MRRRSNLMVLLGIAIFVVGAAIVFIIVRDDDSGSSGSASANTTPVLVAKEDLAAGTKGEDVFDKVEVRNVAISERLADALTAPGQLTNQILARAFTKGEQVTQSGLRVQSLLNQFVTIPDGFEAIAVTTAATAGGAGYIAPGDLVNLYGVVDVPGNREPAVDNPEPLLPYNTPRTELLLTNVRVLDVQAQVAPLAGQTTTPTDSQTVAQQQRQAPGGSLTLLLAVKALDAEKVVFATNFGNSVYFTRVPEENPPVDVTPGVDFWSDFGEEPGAAFQRSGPA